MAMDANLESKATDFVVRLAFLGIFAYWSLELLRPFLPIIIWAVLLAVASIRHMPGLRVVSAGDPTSRRRSSPYSRS